METGLTLGFVVWISLCGSAWGTCHTSENDCIVNYGPWSECDPCLETKSRHLNITLSPRFDGMPCPSALLDVAGCKTSSRCPADLPCPGRFNCGFHGRCVNDSLVCNGDDDCGNNADEKDCPKQTFTRSELECLELPSLPYLDQIGSGVDLTRGALVGRVVDNQRYQGLCRKAYDGNRGKIYRMPYNVNNFHFAVKSSDQLESKVFHSLADYTHELDKSNENSWSESVSAGGGYGLFSASVSESMSYSHKDTFKQIYSTMKDQNANVFSISATLEVAQFVLKNEDFLLDSYFEESLNKLPTKLNTKSYFSFFDQYGAFYLHSGVLGGKYEHNYIFTDEAMKANKQTSTTLAQCLKFSMSASLGFGSFFHASGSGGFDKCHNSAQQTVSTSDMANSATNKVVEIRGGTAEGAGKLVGAALGGNGTFQQSKFEEWALGVQQNPVILSKSFRPVCDLFLSSKASNGEAKYEVCLAAVKAYVQPWSPGGCRGCKNGGKGLNIGGQCQCACLRGWKGQACAEQDLSGSIDTLVPNARGRFQYARNSLLSSMDSKGDIKFIAKGSPPVAMNPPYLHSKEIGSYDGILKTKEDKVYYLYSQNGHFMNAHGRFNGEYKIIVLTEYLAPFASVKINFGTIPECANKNTAVICNVRDYDIDMHGYYLISVQISETNSESVTNVYKINSDGNRVLTIPNPCDNQGHGNGNIQAFVSTTCEDSILISCPTISPATLKVFTSSGKPQGLSQFSGFGSVSGLQYFNGAVWFHTVANQVAAYDIETWGQVFSYTHPTPESGDALRYSQELSHLHPRIASVEYSEDEEYFLGEVEEDASGPGPSRLITNPKKIWKVQKPPVGMVGRIISGTLEAVQSPPPETYSPVKFEQFFTQRNGAPLKVSLPKVRRERFKKIQEVRRNLSVKGLKIFKDTLKKYRNDGGLPADLRNAVDVLAEINEQFPPIPSSDLRFMQE